MPPGYLFLTLDKNNINDSNYFDTILGLLRLDLRTYNQSLFLPISLILQQGYERVLFVKATTGRFCQLFVTFVENLTFTNLRVQVGGCDQENHHHLV